MAGELGFEPFFMVLSPCLILAGFGLYVLKFVLFSDNFLVVCCYNLSHYFILLSLIVSTKLAQILFHTFNNVIQSVTRCLFSSCSKVPLSSLSCFVIFPRLLDEPKMSIHSFCCSIVIWVCCFDSKTLSSSNKENYFRGCSKIY